MSDTRNHSQLRRRGQSPHPSLLGAVALSICATVALGSARAEKPGADDAWILVDAKTHTLSVYRDGRLLDRFSNVAIGRGGFSQDRMRGDGTTPLGTFHIDRIKRPSRFRVFFGIDYPRPEHALRALEAGRIDADDYQRILRAFRNEEPPPQDTPLGGHLGIHGLGAGDRRIHDGFDWTQGCIALTNAQIARLSRWVSRGMRVEVR